jgi:hypothetical protein
VRRYGEAVLQSPRRRFAIAHLFSLYAVVLGLAVPAIAPAQSLLARAVVIDGTISVSGERDLSFGDVVRGVATTVQVTDPGSGRFLILGVGSAEVTLTFFLPVALFQGASSIPIAFGPTSAGHSWASSPNSATLFDPNLPRTTPLRAGSPGLLRVWLGGTVNVPAAQPAGLYASPVTLVVAYTTS